MPGFKDEDWVIRELPAWDKELLEAVALSLVAVERQLALVTGLSYSPGDLIEAKDDTNPLAHASLNISMAMFFVSMVLNEGEYSMPFAYLSGLLLAEAEGLDDEFLAEAEGLDDEFLAEAEGLDDEFPADPD